MQIRLLKALLSEKGSDKVGYIGQIGLETYDQFLMSQLFEAAHHRLVVAGQFI